MVCYAAIRIGCSVSLIRLLCVCHVWAASCRTEKHCSEKNQQPTLGVNVRQHTSNRCAELVKFDSVFMAHHMQVAVKLSMYAMLLGDVSLHCG